MKWKVCVKFTFCKPYKMYSSLLSLPSVKLMRNIWELISNHFPKIKILIKNLRSAFVLFLVMILHFVFNLYLVFVLVFVLVCAIFFQLGGLAPSYISINIPIILIDNSLYLTVELLSVTRTSISKPSSLIYCRRDLRDSISICPE